MSIEGDPGYNMRLSCARALEAKRVVEAVLRRRGVTATFRVFTHGATPGNRELQRSVVMTRQTPTPPPPEPEPEPEPEPAPTHICGPDIDSQLTSVWTRIQSTFAGWTNWQKYRNCAGLLPAGPIVGVNPVMAWDIRDLFLPNTGWLHASPYVDSTGHRHCGVPGPPPREDPANCSNSVRVGDQCHLAGTANYGTFGILCKLCHDHCRSNAWNPFVLCPAYFLFNESAMRSLIWLWKTVDRDDPGPPTDWAVATFNGGPRGRPATQNRPLCTGRCPFPSSRSSFDFIWEPNKPR